MRLGKSAFLGYLLIKRLAKAKPTALTWRERPSEYFIFDEHGVSKRQIVQGDSAIRIVGGLNKNIVPL